VSIRATKIPIGKKRIQGSGKGKEERGNGTME
jgi:hypothetical protein